MNEGENPEGSRPAWLGEPIEHGGGYRAAQGPGWLADAGCCLVELVSVFGVLVALTVLPAWLLLS